MITRATRTQRHTLDCTDSVQTDDRPLPRVHHSDMSRGSRLRENVTIDVISRRWNNCDSVATSAQKIGAVRWKRYKFSVLREHKASLVFSLGNGFQVRNLLVSCRPSRYSKPTRLLTGACSPRMASSVILRAVQGIQISLLFTRNTCRFGKYLISFSTELHYNVCTNDPTQHFDLTGCRTKLSKHRTTGDILLVGESSSRQEQRDPIK